MCEIGTRIEMIDVEPWILPAPLRKKEEAPAEQPVTIEVRVTSDTTVEPVTVSTEKP